ncbi:MAG: hypothetical protein JXB07_16420 [Anaerolineae bacterium]|nr:hypothetical protein [Anaerolineae bacterium]
MQEFFNTIVRSQADYARNRVTWEGASMVERATFGKLFKAVEGILGLIAFVGLFFVLSITPDVACLPYVCILLWLAPFTAAGIALARFRYSIFKRVRGTMNRFLASKMS